jgi:dethiobiotin synthetase
MVPIRPDYFMSDLAVEMKLPVLVVTQNRLGCLNHTLLTVRSVADYNVRCLGVVLNGVRVPGDIAALTNADVLERILNVPLLVGLGENLMELPVDWRLMLDSARDLSVLT